MNEGIALDDPRVFLTRRKVSEILGISVRSVDRIREKGLLREEDRVGNVVLFVPEDVSTLSDYYERRAWFLGAGNGAE